MKKMGIALAAAMGCGALAVNNASAETYYFVNISANNVANAAAGESQLSVEVTDLGGGQVLFTFMNVGPEAMSIADVYFDDGTLLGIAYLIDADDNGGDAGVDFTQNATPGNLPSGNSADPDFETTAGFSADSDPPVQPNGVNPGETLGIVFNLKGGGTFADVIAELADGRLRIGIHVQGFENGGSESFINGGGPPPVPMPAGVALGLAGLVPVIGRRRR